MASDGFRCALPILRPELRSLCSPRYAGASRPSGGLLNHRLREVVIVDRARYATNFLYNQRRPSWRRQTCPRTSRPVMLRLGMMTRRRCQVVGLAVRRFNPNVRMLMVVSLIDAMLPHLARVARCRPHPQRASRRPLIGFHDRAPAATA